MLGMSFLLGLHYYDPGVNLAVLFYSWLVLWSALGLAGVLFWRQQGRFVSAQPSMGAGLALAALVYLCLHHLWFSVSKDTSFAPTMLLAMLPVVYLLTSLLSAARLYTGLFFITALITLYAALRYLIWQDRAHEPLLDPNNFVTLLSMVWLPWLHLQVTNSDVAQPWRRLTGWPLWLVACASGVFVLALLATHSRFAWLVVVAACCGWILLWVINRSSISLPRLAACIGAVGAAALTYWLLGNVQVANNISGTLAVAESSNELSRWLLMLNAWQMFVAEGGGLGSGLYTYSLLYPGYRPLLDQSTTGLFVHNDYLQLLLELGWPALLVLMALAAWVVVRTLQAVWRDADWRFGFWLGLGVALLHAQLNFVFYILPLTMVVALLLAVLAPAFKDVAVTQASQGRATQSKTGMVQALKAGPLVLAGSLALPVVWLGLDAFTYGVFGGQPGMPGAQSVRQDPQAALAYAQFAQRWNGSRGIPVLAEAQLRRGLASNPSDQELKGIAAVYQHSIQVDPWNPAAYTAMAEMMSAQPSLEGGEPLALRTQAWRLAPQRPEAALALMRQAIAQGHQDQALEVALEVTLWCGLIGRRDVDQLDDLGRFVAGLNKQWQDSRLALQLEQCRQARRTALPAKRRATWLQEWLQLYGDS